jgi:hypothetical protein
MRTLLFFGWLALNLFGSSSSDQNTYSIARKVIPEPYQTHVISVYGKGTPSELRTWYITFYDPDTELNARVVVIEKDKIQRFHPAEGKSKYRDAMSFDPSLNKFSAEGALSVARDYAQKNQISYDHVNLLLRRPDEGKAPIWRVQLIQGDTSRGSVYLNSDGTFSHYESSLKESSKDSGAQGFFKDVERTFKGVGGDLEEFFTGERSVDK